MSASVIQLPTAALRKVRQCWSRTRAADRKALLHFPAVYRTQMEREAEASAVLIAQITLTPAMAMAVAMFQTLDPLDQLKAQACLAMIGERVGRMEALQALEYTHFVAADSAKRRAIKRALENITGRA